MLVFVNNQKIHLYKRPSRGIWGGLWSFVECENTPEAIQQTLLAFDPNATISKHLDSFKHTFTHYHLHIHPVVVKCATTDYEFYSLQQSTLGIPKPVAKIISHLENGDMPSSRQID